jgi:glycine/D-amino acid oxidase-like deaminating enzyme/nitrite reductase/ring-hydroxylating ferredoxin subunit
MKPESGHTTSLWHATSSPIMRTPLTEDARADVCVIGAGIAGMTTAYLLAREGRRVIVLDDGPVGGGETGRTTAHLSDALDDRFRSLERLHGEDGARLAAQSHRRAIEQIAQIAERERIDCDFAWVDGYLYGSEQTTADDLIQERDAALRAGVDVEVVERAPYAVFDGTPVLRYPRQGRVHSLKFLAGLVRCVEQQDGRICTGTHVEAIHGGSPVRIETTAGAVVRVTACVVATNSPISDYVVTHAKQAPYRTFVVAARVPHGRVPDALYWNDADPYNYIRLQPAGADDWLIVGGEDYKTGQKEDDEERLDRLAAWTRERFPMSGVVEYRWSGQVMEPVDGMAFIGSNPDGAEGVYLVTGDSGQGMTHGVIAGMLLSDLILGRDNEWAKLYDPKRISLRAAGELARENLNVARQYAAWLLPGDVDSVEDVPRGEGRVMRRGAHLIAVYCDEHGKRHERSAACTHLRCVVNWNALEKSWDCPCHGSRFDPYGAVLNGPARQPLGAVE